MITSLRGRIGFLFMAFFLLVSISVAATFWTIETQKKDALVINLAGRQRMLIQQMTKAALQIEKGEDEEFTPRSALREATNTFDQTLWALINGGQAPYLPDQPVDIPGTQDPDILASLHQVHHTWDTFRTYLDVMIAVDPGSPEFTGAIRAVERLSPDLVQQADEVVRLYETASARKVARMRWIQAAFFASALGLLAVGFWVVRKSVLRPVRVLGSMAGRIGQGDLNTPVEITGPQELARLAHSFDTMRAQLKASQEELVAWTEELEARVAQRTRELAALNEVSREISSRLDINHVLRSVTDKARDLLGSEVAFLCLLDDEGRMLNLQAISGPQDAVRGTRALIRQPLVDQVLAGDRALPCGIDGCVGSCGILAAPFRVSHLAAPLRVGQHIIGALCVGGSQAGLFSGEAVTLLTKLANSAAIALENARLYEQAERVAMLEERQRIAAEMHDGLAQTLNYLGLKTEQAIECVQTRCDHEVLDALKHMGTAIAQASQEVRQSIANLQEGPQVPRALQDRLAEMVDEFAGDGGPPVELVVKFQVPLLLPPAQVEQVLHVIREALLNARRHARARHITVCLEWRETEAAVTVEDDGRGFDPNALGINGRSHFGLRIMRARAARIGGQLAIRSTGDRGTRVTLKWPVDVHTASQPIEGQRTPDEGRRMKVQYK